MKNVPYAVLVAVVLAAAPSRAGSIDLAPVADTYIAAGSAAGLDHGIARVLQVDGVPRAVAYLAFDLALTAPVTQATLILYPTNSAANGGVVYAVPPAGWIEGTASGGVGPGLTWTQVDVDGNGVLDARDGSPLVPDPARALVAVGPVTARQLVTIDVTAAVAGANGITTLAIASDARDGWALKSRDAAADRPILRLVTADTSPPPPPPAPAPAPEFACLGQTGPLVTLTGTPPRYSNRALAASTRIDARAVSFTSSPTNFYPFSIAGGGDICAAGVRVVGQYDRTLGWQAMHDLNNAGVTFTDVRTTVDGARVDDVEDGVRPRDAADGFVIRGTHLSYVRDDCVENDNLNGGLVTDSFFDGCYVGFSARPGSTDTTSDGRTKVWRIENSLIRLQPMPGARPGGVAYPDGYGHGPFFKWDQWDDPANSRSPKLVLRNNVFRADRVTQEGASRMGIPPGQLLDCANNVMVWLGPGPYPAPLPSCFTVTTDRAVWDWSVIIWKAEHPGVAE